MSIFQFLRGEIRMLLWKRGLDVVRRFQLGTTLSTSRIHVVIDVGANQGQFALQLRRLGYVGRIISLEPNKASFRKVQRLTARDNNWEAFCFAVGDKNEEREMNIASHSV